MSESLESIRAMLPEIERVIAEMKETLLANLIIVGEIPAPTFAEEARLQFLTNRFVECGLANNFRDDFGNVLGVIEGESEEDYIMVLAHADTIFEATEDHTITVLPDRVIGPGVGDDSLGLALLATMPTLLERIDYKFHSNILLMGTTRSLGRGNLEGLRSFLQNNEQFKINAGVIVEGVQSGRLSYKSMGMLRGEMHCRVPDVTDWTQYGMGSAIRVMNRVINRINAIRLPHDPKTSIILGAIEGGNAYNLFARKAKLLFEIRSESDELVNEIGEEFELIVAETASETGADISLDIFAKRQSGGIPFKHPLVSNARRLMEMLGIEPHIRPSTGELSAFIDYEIPAITLGLTASRFPNLPNEELLLAPLGRGITMLAAELIAIDRGVGHEA